MHFRRLVFLRLTTKLRKTFSGLNCNRTGQGESTMEIDNIKPADSENVLAQKRAREAKCFSGSEADERTTAISHNVTRLGSRCGLVSRVFSAS